ncbi:M10 family metallopeptidase C-terminal domain-containing protein [Paracoccus sphaerophysae]|uniref:M10 family metallopeptidase C-terminal domain-containing protein n=1 Tax=Paracoccus sphaerophysae TaxID=690417 RepID=UPI00235674EA|nr:M10 family metallopeptidase C-terminal domain-containing protein [Paracoccus sphaerophysae]
MDLLKGIAIGGQGNDTLRNITHVQTGNGNDNLIGNDVGNILNAGAGNDTISGWGGADRIVGGAGTDLMRGGAGDGVTDVFMFGAASDSAIGAAKDTIEDFVPGIDRIDLAAIDANAAAAGDQAFGFSGTTARAYSVW